jgi:hypothetical protein
MRFNYRNFEGLRIKELVWKEDFSEGDKFSFKSFAPMANIHFSIDNIENGKLKYYDNIDRDHIIEISSVEEGKELAQTRFEDFVMSTFFEKDVYEMNLEQFMIEIPIDLPYKYFHDEKTIKKMFFRYEHGIYEFIMIVDENLMLDTDAYDDMHDDFYTREMLYRAQKVHTDFTLMEDSENLNINLLKSDGYEFVYDVNDGFKIDSLNKILSEDNLIEFNDFVGKNLRPKIKFDPLVIENGIGQSFHDICSIIYKNRNK